MRRFLLQPILFLVLVLSGTTVWAASTSIATNVVGFVHDSLFGGYAKVTNTVFAVDQGFSRAAQAQAASGTSPSSRIPFSSSPMVATNGITQGDWVVTFAVNTTASTPANAPFNVTLIFNQGATSSTLKLYLKTGTIDSTTPPEEILCEFDIGPSLASPYSYTFTVT